MIRATPGRLSATLTLALALGCAGGDELAARSRYEVVHGWPALPAGTILGQVAGLGVADERVFVFRRAERSWFGGPVPDVPIASPAIVALEADGGAVVAQMGAGAFVVPHGLTVAPDGTLWVTDVGRHQVLHLDARGEPLLVLGERGVPGTDARHFDGPTDVALAPDGSIFVSDGYGNSRVVKFDRDGRFVLAWGTPGEAPGQFRVPHGLAMDEAGRLHVADRGNARVQIFDQSGALLGIWQSEALGRPWALAFAPDGHAFVVDGGDQPAAPPDRARIVEVDAAGRPLGSFGAFGNQDGQFVWPHDVAVGRDGAVYVGDVSTGMRAQKFVRKGRFGWARRDSNSLPPASEAGALSN